MTLRAADLRFLLPHEVRTAVVLGRSEGSQLEAIGRGLRSAAVKVTGESGADPRRPVDLVVAAAREGVWALQVPARAHLLLGRPAAPVLKQGGRRGVSLLLRGEAASPVTVVPLRPPGALRHFLNEMSVPPSRQRRLRNRALSAVSRAPLPPERLLPASALVTVVSNNAPHLVPQMIRSASAFGVRSAAPWVLSLGTGDDLQRAVFYVLDSGRTRWVVKFARVAGTEASFRRDETGLALVRAAGEVVAAHAPLHLGRFEVAGRAASVETAGPGRPLLPQVARRTLPLLETIAAWILRIGTETAAPPSALGPERSRLENDVVPPWRSVGAPADLVARMPPVPGVLQHNDLGSWNIISDGCDFMAVDWESARPVGFPLWDLLYFLADVLARLDGPAGPELLLRRTLLLFAGRSLHSPLLFRWVRAAVAALGIPAEAVGPLVSLCWMHHGLSAGVRANLLGDSPPAPSGHLARLAQPWLADPQLGPSWSAWSSS